ncbi:ABC transporter substrate-binding protein [Streptosporangium sp. CA-115845]|uniref:ABC transporter substrate-binding protein n=1 Tax=Streptosporangium sp. CA-115845 TaxID=3240071 RepID=UPI003D91BF04
MKVRQARWAALAAAALILPACGAPDDGGSNKANEPFVIMISGGADAGPVTDQLLTALTAARAGVATVNEAGGINGREVKLLESPDNANPTKALSALRAQIAKKKPDAYLVGAGSNVSTAVAPILNQNKILFMNAANIAATGDPKQHPLAFNLAASPQVVVEGYLPMFEANGYKKIGVLHGNSAYAKTFGKLAESVFKGAGYDVVGVEEYDSAALDMTAQISTLRAAGPDVVVFNAYGAPAGYVLKGITKLGWDVPLLGDTSVSSTPLVTQEPPVGLLGSPDLKHLKLEVTKSTVHDPSAEATNRAVKAMTSIGQIKGSMNNCLGYDAILLVAAAAKSANSTEPEAMAKALEDPSVTSAAGTAVYSTYPFSADSHEPKLPLDTHSFAEPGPIVNGQLSSPK